MTGYSEWRTQPEVRELFDRLEVLDKEKKEIECEINRLLNKQLFDQFLEGTNDDEQ